MINLKFRPTKRYWLRKVVIPLLSQLLVYIGVAALASINSNLNIEASWVVGVGLAGIVLFLLVPHIRNAGLLAFRYVLHIDNNGISGRIGSKTPVQVWWSDVTVVWMANAGSYYHPYLFLGTPKDTITVPLAPFDKDRVWEAIASRVSREALQPASREVLPGYKDWVMLCRELEKEVAIRPLRVPVNRGSAAVGWGTMVLFGILTILAFLKGESFAVFMFGALTAMGVLLALSSGSLEMDSEAITYIKRFGQYRLEWSDVRQVELDTRGDRIIFHGDNQRLVIPGLRGWTGSDKDKMHNWLEIQITERQVDTRCTYRAHFKRSKNTKLRKVVAHG